MKPTKCLHCNKEIRTHNQRKIKIKSGYKIYLEKNKSKYCSIDCYHLNARGKPLTGQHLEKSRVCARKMIDARKNNPEVRQRWLLKMKEATIGEKNQAWVKDRSKIVEKRTRRSYEYCRWRREVYVRDKYKCKIDNEDCKGKIEVHHILPYRDYPELHYKVNNGIALCHAHHPRKRSEEKRLEPYFMGLVSVSR